MKTSKIGIVAVAILLGVTGIGFGIAQAAETHSEQAEDMQLASGSQEFVPEGNWSGTDWQARGPVETGAIPGTVSEESWMKDYGND
jgi:hypothetical protein